ncbi:hypothetical protein PRIC2_003029 [Phytophthora ramorum]
MQATSKSGYTTAPANSSAAEPADSSTTSPTASSAAAEVGTLITAPARSFVAAPPISSTAAQDERSTATSTGSFALDGVEYPRRGYATIDVLADDYGRDVSSQKFHKPRAQNSDDNHRKTTSESKLPSKKRRYSPHVPVLKKQKVVLNRETLDDTEYDATEETVPFTGGAEADDLPEYTPRKRATKFDDEVEPLYEDRDEIVNVVPPFPAGVIET